MQTWNCYHLKKNQKMSKQKQFQVRKSCKTHKSTLFCIENFEENIDMSRIHLAVLVLHAQTYLQLPLWQWGASSNYLLVFSSWKLNIAENPIAVMGVVDTFGHGGTRFLFLGLLDSRASTEKKFGANYEQLWERLFHVFMGIFF